MKLLLLISALMASAGAAQQPGDPFYLGTWKIVSAVVAPWQQGAPHAGDTAEMKSLVGKTVTIQPKAIAGPGITACKGPNYRLKDYPANMLFQGAFDEMRRKDASAEPAKIAARLGFRGSSWKTLETGCANELDFHFLDPSTADFALNNYVYTMKKQ